MIKKTSNKSILVITPHSTEGKIDDLPFWAASWSPQRKVFRLGCGDLLHPILWVNKEKDVYISGYLKKVEEKYFNDFIEEVAEKLDLSSEEKKTLKSSDGMWVVFLVDPPSPTKDRSDTLEVVEIGGAAQKRYNDVFLSSLN